MIRAALTLLFASILFVQNAHAFGKTGHRVVGEIAWLHMTKKAQKNVQKVLGTEQLGMVGNHMDFIRSNPNYDHLKYLHYCTMGDKLHYDSTMAPKEGDVVTGINQFINEIKTGEYSQDELFALKCLVHLVGDIHQPLHCGNGTDKGGNDVKVRFFWKNSNLHRVWDSGIIDEQQLSYTEYTAWINTATKDQISKWQNSSVADWAHESKSLHPQVYKFDDPDNLNYEYVYQNIGTVNQRLLQAGIRLAHILNQLYG